MKSKYFDYLLIALITFLVAYAVGLTIVNTVDHRLSNISINMPEIHLPKPVSRPEIMAENYIIRPTVKKIKVLDPPAGEANFPKPTERNDQTNKCQQGGSSAEENRDEPKQLGSRSCTVPPTREFDSQLFKSESKPVEPTKPERRPDLHVMKHSIPASFPSDQNCDSGIHEDQLKSGQLVPTYYRDPKDMTLAQRTKFRNRAKIHKMTVLDYENWLLLFREDPQTLDPVHRKRLRMLQRGDRLRATDIPDPAPKEVPPTAETRFNTKFRGLIENDGPLETADDSHDSSRKVLLHAANHTEYDHYMPPKSLKHLSILNPDEHKKYGNSFLQLIRPKISTKEEN